MAEGLYRTKLDGVVVRLGENLTIIDRASYEFNGYRPPFDKLPTEADYKQRLGRSNNPPEVRS